MNETIENQLDPTVRHCEPRHPDYRRRSPADDETLVEDSLNQTCDPEGNHRGPIERHRVEAGRGIDSPGKELASHHEQHRHPLLHGGGSEWEYVAGILGNSGRFADTHQFSG